MVLGLLVEYRYGLFPPNSGTVFVANQLMFLAAMSCIWVMLVSLWRAKAGGNGRFGKISLGLFI
jgi:hypothetical protein